MKQEDTKMVKWHTEQQVMCCYKTNQNLRISKRLAIIPWHHVTQMLTTWLQTTCQKN